MDFIREEWVRRTAEDLRALGVHAGGVLLVHASLRSLGLPFDLNNRPEVVIRALLESLGPQGTLLMPAFSYKTVGARNPIFHVRDTPSCVGALAEAFRCRAGSRRSVHPTHSVCALGTHAADLLDEHRLDTTPVGPHSPLTYLPQVGGQILFLGCGLRPNTSIHGTEERVVPPYLYGPEVDYRVLLEDGGETHMRVRSHHFQGWEQRYDRVAALMTTGLARGRVLQAECFLLDAAEMWSAALPALRADPLYFVSPI